jgi:hypothetical protein
MLPTQLLSVLHKTPLLMRSWYPPLRQAQGRPFVKNAKDGARHCVGDASEIKSLGHPPITATQFMAALQASR